MVRMTRSMSARAKRAARREQQRLRVPFTRRRAVRHAVLPPVPALRNPWLTGPSFVAQQAASRSYDIMSSFVNGLRRSGRRNPDLATTQQEQEEPPTKVPTPEPKEGTTLLKPAMHSMTVSSSSQDTQVDQDDGHEADDDEGEMTEEEEEEEEEDEDNEDNDHGPLWYAVQLIDSEEEEEEEVLTPAPASQNPGLTGPSFVAQQAASQPYDPYPAGMTFMEAYKQHQAHLAAQANTNDEEEGSDTDSEEEEDDDEEDENGPTLRKALTYCQ